MENSRYTLKSFIRYIMSSLVTLFMMVDLQCFYTLDGFSSQNSMRSTLYVYFISFWLLLKYFIVIIEVGTLAYYYRSIFHANWWKWSIYIQFIYFLFVPIYCLLFASFLYLNLHEQQKVKNPLSDSIDLTKIR